MSIIATAKEVALRGMRIPEDAIAAAEPTAVEKVGEQLTKYIPTEVVGVVTGTYAIIVPLVKDTPSQTRACLAIAALGLLCVIGLYWLQVVAQVRQKDKTTPAFAIGLRPCALGELALLCICYLLWVFSLLSAFFSEPLPAIVGIGTTLVIHMVEPVRKVVVTADCKPKEMTT